MKKLCAILSSLSIVLTTSTTVISCKAGLGLSTNYSDEEKITSIKTINESLLVDNGVSIGDNLSRDDVDKLLKMLKIDPTKPESGVVINSLKSYVMANQLLNEISSKVPGYDWIANKLTWQSQWSLSNLIAKNSNWSNEKGEIFIFNPLANNVSGWMGDKSSWSLSVTFLNDDLAKTPWNGTEAPGYARININKFVRADKEGNVIAGHTIKDPTDPERFNTLKPIPTFNMGPIYQGFDSSSKLLKLDHIYNPEKGKLPPGFINYSPSAADFINNQIFDLDFGNIVLSNAKEKIEQQLNKYLLNNPIWLNEGSEFSDIYKRIKNQIYIAMFMSALEKFEDMFKGDDLPVGKMFMQNWIDQLVTNLNKTVNLEHIIQEEKTKIKNFSERIKKDLKIWLESAGKKQNFDWVEDELNEYIPLSRNQGDPKSEELDFGETNLTINLFKNSIYEEEKRALSKNSDFIDFGFDNFYKFEVLYYSKSFNKQYEDKLWYKPDENHKDSIYVADAGFNNAFFIIDLIQIN